MQKESWTADVVDLARLGRGDVALVGGKAANLGELLGIEGVRVPPGFCVTTHAYRRGVSAVPGLARLLEALAHVDPEDRASVRTSASELRRAVESAGVPEDLATAVDTALHGLSDANGFAVRSSATAEDSAGASFAGQHESYLGVPRAAVVEHVRRCWASLYTERAVAYSLRLGTDLHRVEVAVVVQPMVDAVASGVMFTADPVSGNRRIVTVEAAPGLGQAMVEGRVHVETVRVRDGRVTDRSLAAGRLAVLADEQALALARLGRRIEAHFGCPQDIEWCLAGDGVSVVQSRPITTLYPVPAAADGADHVYVSVGHQQMMTDPMRPLGRSVWQMIALRPMVEAGGRLFVDVTPMLASPSSRAGLLDMMGRSDPLVRDALETAVERSDLRIAAPPAALPAGVAPGAAVDPDPALVAELVARTDASVEGARHAIDGVTGADLLDAIEADVAELKRLLLDPQSMQVIVAAMDASWWLDDRLGAWLGEQRASDPLTLAAPGNVTSDMGLALLDVADAIRPHPAAVAFLRDVRDNTFLADLASVDGGQDAQDAIRAFLDRYGMRCAGEIDLTRPRWSEQTSTLIPLLLGHIDRLEPGEHQRRVERGRRRAQAKEREILERLQALPGGDLKAAEAKRNIDLVRTFIGYREYPKYGIAARLWIYKQALMAEARRLVRAGVLREVDDVFFLTFEELREVGRTQVLDHDLVARRRAELRSFEALAPPRVLTSHGEALQGAHQRGGVPPGALAGTPVSAGVVEGRARVVLDLADADVGAGDILVTTHTDPSWSPLFVAVSALVTEVGGLMTHGAVIAREYGLPAVVGVDHATRRIPDGQRIRVDGTNGHVELLPPAPPGDDFVPAEPSAPGRLTTTPRQGGTATMGAPTDTTGRPPIVDHATWAAALAELRIREKAATRELDAIAAARRRLPMVELPDVTLVGEQGPVRLVDVFEGRTQLITYHHMWNPGAEWQCPGCTGFTSQFTRLEFLDAYDARFVIVTPGTIEEALAYKARVGNRMTWYSTAGSSFGADMGAPLGGGFQVNVFLRDGDTVYRTYNTQGRGVEQLGHTFPLIDLLPYGRQEEWQDSPPGWPQSPTYSRWAGSEEFTRYADDGSSEPSGSIQGFR